MQELLAVGKLVIGANIFSKEFSQFLDNSYRLLLDVLLLLVLLMFTRFGWNERDLLFLFLLVKVSNHYLYEAACVREQTSVEGVFRKRLILHPSWALFDCQLEFVLNGCDIQVLDKHLVINVCLR